MKQVCILCHCYIKAFLHWTLFFICSLWSLVCVDNIIYNERRKLCPLRLLLQLSLVCPLVLLSLSFFQYHHQIVRAESDGYARGHDVSLCHASLVFA